MDLRRLATCTGSSAAVSSRVEPPSAPGDALFCSMRERPCWQAPFTPAERRAESALALFAWPPARLLFAE